MNPMLPLEPVLKSIIPRTGIHGGRAIPATVSRTAVVIISHNYGVYLAEAIRSALRQTVRAQEILVIDDASDDNTAAVAAEFAEHGVRYHRIEQRHVYGARLAGAEQTRAEYLCFLDADDVLSRSYLAAAQMQLDDPRVGIVACDLERFGAETGVTVLNPDDNIELNNICCSASVVRRAALESIRLPDPGEEWPCQSHADWFLFRAIARTGWKIVKQTERLRYRRHPAAMLRTTAPESYRVRANLDLETVQIVIPLAGRKRYMGQLQWWCERQTWPNVRLLIADTGPDPAVRASVRRYLATRSDETLYLPLPPTGPIADLERRGRAKETRLVSETMPRIYNAIRERVCSEYVFWLEDDVLPPLDVITRLMNGVDANVACVSGMVPSRWEPNRVMAWQRNLSIMQGRGDGLEDIHGTGFGCLLVRRSALQLQPFQARGRSQCYDQEFAAVVAAAGMRWRIDWGVGCNHAGVAPDSIQPRKIVPAA